MTTGATPAAGRLTLVHLSKTYGKGISALADVSLRVRPGEICVALGENGAGKTTLMKILGGLIPCTDYQGDIQVDGQPVQAHSPRETTAAGISVIAKRSGVFRSMTVADNVAVSQWQSGGGLIVHRDRVRKEAQASLELLDMHLDLDARADTLSLQQQRMLVIARALASQPRVIVLDEPAATLTTPQELSRLFRVVRLMAEREIAVLYLSRRVPEAMQIADRIVVLRDGAVAGERPRSDFDETVLMKAMLSQRIGDGAYVDYDEQDGPRTLLDTFRSWFGLGRRD
jgi:ABC-type sugar transport system ATPase subunit